MNPRPLVLGASAAVAFVGGFGYAVWRVPNQLMRRAYAAYQPTNSWVHGVVDAGTSKSWVPLGNPDILPSRASFDLADGPLLLTGPAPEGTYWSLTMYDHRTINFFVLNNRRLRGGDFEVALVRQGDRSALARAQARGCPVAVSPTRQGYLVQRTFVDDSSDLALLRKTRADCAIAPLP